MPFRLRKPLRFGPLQLNVTERGVSSVTIRLGRRVSFNTRTRRITVDTPGPGSWTSPRVDRNGGRR